MDNLTKTLLIINGNAGQKNLQRSLETIVPILAAAHPKLLILQTEKPSDAENFCRTYGREADAIYIYGGDGTVHECINGIAPLEKQPRIAILPGGTCNDFARTLNIPLNLKAACEALVNGKEMLVDAAAVNDDYYLNFWGIGLITEASNNIDGNQKALLGKISYFLSAFKTVQQIEPFSFKLMVDGEEIEDKAVMILAANGQYIGTNLLPYPGISIQDGKADIFILKETNLSVIKDILNMRGSEAWDNTGSSILHFQGSQISISTESEMEADTDGEVYGKTPAMITVKKQHLRMAVPAEE
ncbi:YegS/Rv2252/BmrU family lipid kinase [Metabacillus sp. GX 13764]|uniref:diacylglycerol/lipid kinase family protein n=1 Tax=Metabacillus kandeliae TaxID=2900151 RepID=UPI001E37E5A1|nr:YegS/Rv2252/BmrU family lipid kinase [Metabacillus kandeliae]MCD7033232.1 YegS/Rv2252/BmrU family lipid kinase [Metabacillus kandeliae]